MIPKTWQELEKYCEEAVDSENTYCKKCFAKNCCNRIRLDSGGMKTFFQEAFKKSLVYHRKEKLKKLLS